jgi:hypothetical protein
LRDIEKGKLPTPDMIVVGTDGNCNGYTARRQEIEKVAKGYLGLGRLIIYGIIRELRARFNQWKQQEK